VHAAAVAVSASMKQRGRRNSKVPAAEVVDLVSDSEDEPEATAAAAAPAKTFSRGNSRGNSRAAATAAAAAIAGSAHAAAQDDEFEFVDSDFELEAETQPQQKQQQASATQGRKRALPTGRPISGASKGSAANGSAPAGPAAKRARTAAAGAAAAAKGGSRAPSSKGSKAAGAKSAAARVSSHVCKLYCAQCAVVWQQQQRSVLLWHESPLISGWGGWVSLQRRSCLWVNCCYGYDGCGHTPCCVVPLQGFNALLLCASQHTGGSQGSAEVGGSQQAGA
jgi:hypothetical protein